MTKTVPRPSTGKTKKDKRIIEIDQKIDLAKKTLRVLKDEKRQLLKRIEREKTPALTL